METFRMSKGEINQISVFEKLVQKVIKQKDASSLLDLSVRQIQRKLKSFKHYGFIGLAHKSRGRPSNNQLDENVKELAIKVIKRKYPDFGPMFAAEKLYENHNLKINHETLRQLMIKNDLWKTKKQKIKHRDWRERKEYYGQMIQFDGSHHSWFADRAPKCVLLAGRDDATNKTTALFTESEGTTNVFHFWQKYILKHGKPKSIYLDRHSIYKTTRPVQAQGENLDLTQFKRALEELDIKVIHAQSPQAKGRIENVFGTLQDRLVKELRLHNIQTIDKANRFLKEVFLPKFNQRFSIIPTKPINLHQRLNKNQLPNLSSIFSIHSQRYINNDFTIRFQSKWLQLEKVQPT